MNKFFLLRVDPILKRLLASGKQTGPDVIKLSFMLNIAEYEILNAHNYENKFIQHFSGSDKHRMLFFLLINTIVGILTLMSKKIFKLS